MTGRKRVPPPASCPPMTSMPPTAREAQQGVFLHPAAGGDALHMSRRPAVVKQERWQRVQDAFHAVERHHG